MGASTHQHPRIRRACPERCRKDGWTPERQLRFLDALARTGSVTRAAAFAGMSRESAYRLRDRRDGALFAAAWNRAQKGHSLVSLVSLLRRVGASISGENPPKVHKVEEVDGTPISLAAPSTL